MPWISAKCKLTHFGLNRVTSPHFCQKYPGMYIPIAGQETTWKESHDLGLRRDEGHSESRGVAATGRLSGGVRRPRLRHGMHEASGEAQADWRIRSTPGRSSTTPFLGESRRNRRRPSITGSCTIRPRTTRMGGEQKGRRPGIDGRVTRVFA